ncbi:hypothetical protein JW859_10570 [bacterium]|nr:hypothetical protein [bacterium]
MLSNGPALMAIFWQAAMPRAQADALKFTVYVGLFVLVVAIVMYFVFKNLRPKTDNSATDKLREEFEKSKDTLLMAAQARKAAREAQEGAERQQDAEAEEREMLLNNVDPELVFGKTCPLSGLEMMNDQDLVIDPYTGQGYHFSSFLNDWPANQERPKYIYRYPQGTIVRSDQMVGSFKIG